MTNDELEAIRARDAADYPAAEVLRKLAGVAGNRDPDMQATIDMIADRRALLAEVDRLRREAETDNHNLTHMGEANDALRQRLAEAEAEALLREASNWRMAIECVAPELGGAIMTLNRIDAFLARDSASGLWHCECGDVQPKGIPCQCGKTEADQPTERAIK